MKKRKIFWTDTAERSPLEPLYSEEEADVAIVGGGITGLTAAYLLTAEGKKVVVLEAGNIGGSTTAMSSAHLSTESDYYYSKIISRYGEDAARDVADSRKHAIDFIAGMANDFPCDFKYVSGFLFSKDETKELEDEYVAASKAGLEVEMNLDLQLPFDVKRAVEFKRQAIFNPYKYITSIAEYLQASSLCSIYENSRVVKREKDVLFTAGGNVRAREIIYATHYPVFIDLHQTLVYAYRSYMLAARVKDEMDDSLYWDTADPYHYIRSYNKDGQKYLLLGGADHKTGHTETDAYEKLERYLQLRFDVQSIDYRWSSQFYEPADGLPFIGKSYSGNEYIATGFSGDGLVFGTLSGILISDLILKKEESSWHEIYNARRLNIKESAAKFGKENIHVAEHIVSDRFPDKYPEDAEKLKEGEGMLVNSKGKTIAVSRDQSGKLLEVSGVCPHLKCIVHWNKNEQSWDCPCHGSRFSANGSLLSGPAVEDLKKKDGINR